MTNLLDVWSDSSETRSLREAIGVSTNSSSRQPTRLHHFTRRMGCGASSSSNMLALLALMLALSCSAAAIPAQQMDLRTSPSLSAMRLRATDKAQLSPGHFTFSLKKVKCVSNMMCLLLICCAIHPAALCASKFLHTFHLFVAHVFSPLLPYTAILNTPIAYFCRYHSQMPVVPLCRGSRAARTSRSSRQAWNSSASTSWGRHPCGMTARFVANYATRKCDEACMEHWHCWRIQSCARTHKPILTLAG